MVKKKKSHIFDFFQLMKNGRKNKKALHFYVSSVYVEEQSSVHDCSFTLGEETQVNTMKVQQQHLLGG